MKTEARMEDGGLRIKKDGIKRYPLSSILHSPFSILRGLAT
jgi:hypothetical protein